MGIDRGLLRRIQENTHKESKLFLCDSNLKDEDIDEEKSLLIFDFDGVICDSFHQVILAINSIVEPRLKKSIPSKSELDRLRQLETIEIFEEFGIEKNKLPGIVFQLQKILGSQMISLKVIEGMKEALEMLHQQKIRMGILSSNARENIILFLDQYKINFFDFIQEGVFFNKGEMLRNIIQELSCDPKEVFYVGDEARDILASREANIHSIAVTWGFNAREVLVKHKPDHLLDSPKELISLFVSKTEPEVLAEPK